MTPKQHAKNLLKECKELLNAYEVKLPKHSKKDLTKAIALIAIYQVQYTLENEIKDSVEAKKLINWYDEAWYKIKYL